MEYEFPVDGSIVARVQPPEVDGFVMTFRAQGPRLERTGYHATVSIEANVHRLTWGLLNVERSEDRTKLGNAAHKRLQALSPVAAKAYSAAELKVDLDDFCAHLQQAAEENVRADLLGPQDIPCLKYLLEPYILDGGGTILFAPPGRGKTYLALCWAIAVDAGLNGMFKTERAPVLFVNLERSRDSVARRVRAVNVALGLKPNRPLAVLTARGKPLSEIAGAVRREVVQRTAGLIVVDSISRTGFGDLTENAPVNKVMDTLNGLCPSWLALAHTPREDATHAFGSQMFDAAADLMVQLVSQDTDKGLGLGVKVVKANDVKMGPMEFFGMEMSAEGLTRFWRAGEREFPALAPEPPLHERIRRLLLSAGKLTVREIAEELAVGDSLVRMNLNQRMRDAQKVGDEWCIRGAVS